MLKRITLYIKRKRKPLKIYLLYFLGVFPLFAFPTFASFDRETSFEIINTFGHLRLELKDSELTKDKAHCANVDELGHLLLINSLSPNTKAALGLTSDLQVSLSQFLLKPSNNTKFTDYYYDLVENTAGGNKDPLYSYFSDSCRSLESSISNQFKLNEKTINIAKRVAKSMEDALRKANLDKYLNEFRSREDSTGGITLKSMIKAVNRLAKHAADIYTVLDDHKKLNSYKNYLPKSIEFLNITFPVENQWKFLGLTKSVAGTEGTIPQIEIEKTDFDGSNLNSSLRLLASVELSLHVNGSHTLKKSTGLSLFSFIDLNCLEPEKEVKSNQIDNKRETNCRESTSSYTNERFTIDHPGNLIHPLILGSDIYNFLSSYRFSEVSYDLVGERLIVKPKFKLYINETEFLSQTIESRTLDKQTFVDDFAEKLKAKFREEQLLFLGESKRLRVIDLEVYSQPKLLVKALAVNQHDGLVYELIALAKDGSLKQVNDPTLSPSHLFLTQLRGERASSFDNTNAKVTSENVEYELSAQGVNSKLASHFDLSRYKKNCYQGRSPSCKFVNLSDFKWISDSSLGEVRPTEFKELRDYLMWIGKKLNLQNAEKSLYGDLQNIIFGIDSEYTLENKASYSNEHFLALERRFFTKDIGDAIDSCLKENSEICDGTNINEKFTNQEKLVEIIFNEYCTSVINLKSQTCTITKGRLDKLVNWWQEKVKDDEAVISLVDFDTQIIKSPDCKTRNSVELILNSQTVYLYPRSTENDDCVDGVPTIVDAFYKTENADKFEYLTSIPFYFFQVNENKLTEGSSHLIKNVISIRLKALHNQIRFKEELYATTALHIKALKKQFHSKAQLNLESIEFPKASDFDDLIAESNLFFLKAINENIESFLKTGEHCSAQSSSQNCLEFTVNLSTKSKYKFLIFSPSNLLMVEEKEEPKLSSNTKGNFYTLPKEQLFTSYLKITPPKLVLFSTSVTDSANEAQNKKHINDLNNLFSIYKLDHTVDPIVTEFNLPKSFEIRIVDIKESTISIEADSRKLEIRNCELSKIHSLLGKFSKVNRCIAVDTGDEANSLWQQLNKINKFKLAGHYKLLDLKKEITSYEEYTVEPELQKDLEELEKELKKRKMIWDSVTNFINEPMPRNPESVYDIFNTISKFYLSVSLPIIRGPCDFDFKPKMLAALNEVGYFSDGNPQLLLPRLVCDVKYDSEGKNIESSKVNLLAFNLFDSKETTISKELTSDLFTSNSTNPLDNSAFIKLNNFYYSLLDNACIKVNDKASECKSVTYSSDWHLLKEYLELENVEFKFKKEGEKNYAYAVAHINDKATPLFFYDRNTTIQHLRKAITSDSTAGLIMPTKAEINFSINYWAKKSQSYLLSDAALLKQIYGVDVTPELEKLEEDYSAFIEKKESKETFKDYLYRKFELEIKGKAIKEAEKAFRELFTKEEFDKLTKEQRALNWSSDNDDPPTTIVLASCPLFDFRKDEKKLPIQPLKYEPTVNKEEDENTGFKISVKDFLEKPNRIFDNCHENYRKLIEALISSVLSNYDSELNEDKLKTKLEALLSKELPLNQQEGIGWLKLKPMSLVEGNPYVISKLKYSLESPSFEGPCEFFMANSLDKIAVNLAKQCIKPYINNLVNYDKVVDKVIRPIVGVAEGLINCGANDKNGDLLACKLQEAKVGFKNNKFYFEVQNCDKNNDSCFYYLHPETFLEDEAIRSYVLSNNLKLTDTVKEFQSQLGKIVNDQVKIECFSSELKKTNCDAKVEIITLNYLGKELQISTKQIERSLKTQLSGAMVWYLSHVSGFPESVIGCNALTCELNISDEIQLTFDVYNDFSSPETLYSKIAPALLQQVNEVTESIILPNDYSVSVDCNINTGCSIKLISSDSVYTLRPEQLQSNAIEIAKHIAREAFLSHSVFSLGLNKDFLSIKLDGKNINLILAGKQIELASSFFEEKFEQQGEQLVKHLVEQHSGSLCKDEKDTLAFSELNAFPEYSLVLQGSCTKYEVNGSTQSSYRLAELIFDLKKAGKSEIQIPLSKLLEPNVFLKEIESASWQYAKTYIEKSLNEKFLNFGGHSIVVTLPSTLSGLSGEVEVSINGQTIPPYSFKLLEKDVQKQIQELYTGLVRHTIHKKFKQQLTKQCKTAVTSVNKLLPIKELTDSEISQRCDKFDVEHLQQDINSFSKTFVISQVKNLILNSQEVATLISNINNFVGARVVVVQNDNLYIEGELIEVRGKTIEAAIDSWIVSSRTKIQRVLENKLRKEIFKELIVEGYQVSFEEMNVKIVKSKQIVLAIDIHSLLDNPEKEIASKLRAFAEKSLDEKAIGLAIKIAEKVLLTLNPEIKLDPSADKLKATWSKGKTRWHFTENYQNASDIGKFVEAATIDYSIFQAQLALNKSIETPLNNLCAKINRSELSSFPVPLLLQCSENRDVTASFELMGETFIVKSGIDFKSGEYSNGDIKTISPEINLAKLKVSPSISSFVTTKLNSIAPDIKVQDVRFESKSIHLEVSYYFSPLDTNIKTEIILDKQNGLSINVDSKAFAKQAICNGAKEYVVNNQNAINELYKDVQISANPICTTNELTIPISVSMSAQSLGQFDIPGAVIVPLDGLPKIKLHLNDLFSFSNVLKEYLGSVNIGGTELREPYYHVENGEVKLFLRSALELEVIPGFGNIAADYSINNKGIKFDGTIWITSSIWYDIFPPYLAVGEFGVGLNPTEKTIGLKGAATISPGEAVSTLARFNGEATLPLDLTEAYFKMKGELLMPGQTKLAHGNACIGKAANCDVSDVSSKTHLLDVNINAGIPGLRFINLDGNLRMQDDEEFIRVSAAGRLLGAELAKAKLTLTKALRGKLGAEIDLKIVDFEAEAKTSPALVPSALKFNGELKNVVKFSGMADIDVGVSAALEPQGDLKYIIPGFSITVPSFGDLFSLLAALELSLTLSSDLPSDITFGDFDTTKKLDGVAGSVGAPKLKDPENSKLKEPAPIAATTSSFDIEFNPIVQKSGCIVGENKSCGGWSIGGNCLWEKHESYNYGFFVDKDSKGVSEYFQIPTGRKNEWNNCHRHERKNLFEYRLGKQKNGYQIARRNQSDNVVVEISEIGRQPKFVLTHNKLKFSTDDYNFAVLDLVGDRFAIIVADGFYHLAKNGTEMPIDGFKSDLDKIRQINVRPFSVAYKGGLEQYQHRIFRMMAETHVGGHRFQELRKSNGEDLVNEQQAIFKILIKGDVEDKHYWVNFHKNLPRSFEIISDESKFSELFKLLNAFPAGVLTSQNCGEEQVRIDKATCGLVIQLTDKATLVLSNHQNSGFSNAWLVTEQHGVIAGQWRPSRQLLKDMAINNEPLIDHIKDSGKLKKYLAKAIHSELTAGFNLILGKSECSLTPKNLDCKPQIRVATIYDSTTSDTKLEIFHSSDKCLLSSKKEINEFWQLTDLNLTRQENLIINGKINHEKMLESIIDESWQDNWRANPIGPFKQGTLNKEQGGCEYGNN